MNLNIPHNSERTFRPLRLVALVMMAVMLIPAFAGESSARRKGSSKKQSDFTVVIDAGHGGHDHGAIDNGAREKDINLGVAKKLAALLKKKAKGVNVVMTRDDDTFISLQERANIANRNKGNLFISIHTNSVDKSNPNRKSVQGATVYALGPQKDANNLKVAQRENSVIELESDYHQKYSGFDPSKDESYIIFEMAQKKNLGQSLKFAEKAQKQLVKVAGRGDRGVKQAGFWVLWATSMPSVLVELDFICNPKVASYLNSDAGQEELAKALFNAVESYVKAWKNPRAEADIDKDVSKTAAAETLVADNDISEENTLLVASSPQPKVPRKAHVEQKNTRKTGSGSRRRRSESSRKLSENRNIEAESITLKSETDFLAVQEKPREEVKPAENTEASDADSKGKKGKKNKKNKNKKDKDKKDKNKSSKSKKDNSRRNDKNPNQKTFVVKKKSDKEIKAEASEDIRKAVPAKRQPAAGKMVYKIQILASDTEKQAGDPAFCGIVPTGMFKENGLYKYTFGSSESRSEIESKLLEIKSVIPDAFIVVRME